MNDKLIEIAREVGFTIGPVTDEIYSAPGGIRAELEHFASLVQADFKTRLADVIQQMPFGDTASSFATFVREFK